MSYQTAKERYFLPEGYKTNPVTTFNTGDGPQYWDAKRLLSGGTFDYQFPVYQLAAQLLKERELETLIDVGCGAAAKLSWLHKNMPGIRIIGIDQPDAVEFCKTHHQFGEWFTDNFDSPSGEIPEIQSGLVLCCDVIEHVENPDSLLSYLKSFAGPDTVFLISTPDRAAKYGANKMESGHRDHVREWDFKEFRTYLEDRGFEILDHRHQMPVRMALSKTLVREVISQVRSGNRLFYNQVCLMRLPGKAP